jgi:tRNA G18 (ribose-2'-O)-methylase SpoU
MPGSGGGVDSLNAAAAAAILLFEAVRQRADG